MCPNHFDPVSSETLYILFMFISIHVQCITRVHRMRVKCPSGAAVVLFSPALEEAAIRFRELQAELELRQLQEDRRNNRKPPPFKLIKVSNPSNRAAELFHLVMCSTYSSWSHPSSRFKLLCTCARCQKGLPCLLSALGEPANRKGANNRR